MRARACAKRARHSRSSRTRSGSGVGEAVAEAAGVGDPVTASSETEPLAFRGSGPLQEAQRPTRHALAGHACGGRIVVLADAAAVSVRAAAVAAEHQLVLMAFQEISGECGIA